jgi:hypothetical protein
VAIRASSAREIDALIADLASERAVVRETAIARLTVIGSRAVIHLTDLAGNPGAVASTRIAALRALESIGDLHAIDAATRALNDADKGIAVTAASVLQRFLTAKRGAEVTDALTAKALDRQAGDAVRLAALVSLQDLGPAALEPLWSALVNDSSTSVRAHVHDAQHGESAEIDGDETARLPADPEKLRRELSLGRGPASLPELHHLVERMRAAEESASGDRRDAWTRARGAAHVALAKRGSRLGLYDLRESLEKSAGPLPVEFMAALSLAGDATCLESIAAAYSHAPAGNDAWWRDHLADAFHAIVRREHVTARHAVMRKIQKRWPAIVSTT